MRVNVRFRIFALLLLVGGCQTKKSSGPSTIVSFVNHWVDLANQNEVQQLNDLLLLNASEQTRTAIRSLQLAEESNIDVRFDPHRAAYKRLTESEYTVSLPFVLSGRIRQVRTDRLQLTVQRDAFGTYRVARILGDLTLYVNAAQHQRAATETGKQGPSSTPVSSSVGASKAATVQRLLTHPDDTIIYYTRVDSTWLFYVARGYWSPWVLSQREKSEEGDYRMGVVDARGRELIPTIFDKIYNPGGTLPGLIEVERDGKRGCYNIVGQPVVSVAFEGIYPYSEDQEVLAQVKFDGRYGWLDPRGNLNLDPSTHPDADLFASPAASERILRWRYETRYEGLTYLRFYNRNLNYQRYDNIIITPSYLYDLKITDEYNTNILTEDHPDHGYGAEGEQVSFIEMIPFTQRIKAFVAEFIKWGPNARDYHYHRGRRLFTLNEQLQPVATVSFEGDYQYYSHPELPFRETTLFEVRTLGYTQYPRYNHMTQYDYYQIGLDGSITSIATKRIFSFTKFNRVTKENFTGEFRNGITTADDEASYGYYQRTNHLSIDDLDVMCNEIFAEYGYRFKSEKWQRYFGQQSWYDPRYDNVDDKLSDIDRYNVQFIRDYQQKMRGHEQEYVQCDTVPYSMAG